MTLTGVVITRDESKSIRACLESLSFCDEIVVVDSGSTDDTGAIAASMGAKVIHHAWEGFGLQKKFAISCAQGPWILSLDADERISPPLAREITALKNCNFNGKSSFFLPFKKIFLGKKLNFGQSRGEKHLRLFHREGATIESSAIHEGFSSTGAAGYCSSPVFHDSYRSIDDYFVKFNHYTTLWATANFKRGKKAKPLLIMIRFPFDFIACYLLKGGIFDGWPGFVAAVFHAFYSLTKYAKLRELSRESETIKRSNILI